MHVDADMVDAHTDDYSDPVFLGVLIMRVLTSDGAGQFGKQRQRTAGLIALLH